MGQPFSDITSSITGKKRGFCRLRRRMESAGANPTVC
jgi:hypothetical protein